MIEEQMKAYASLPQAESSRLIDFERVELVTLESFPPQFVVSVAGTKPYLNMEVELVPRVHIRRPEYWEIEVVVRLRGGIGLPALAPYTVSLNLTGVTGTRGIEVIGATRSERLDVPPDGPGNAAACRGWAAWHDHQPPGPPVLHVVGECEFPTAGFSVELRRKEPQGLNPKDLLLERVVYEPQGPAATVITTVEARYREETDFEYATVTILPDGARVPVEEVS